MSEELVSELPRIQISDSHEAERDLATAVILQALEDLQSRRPSGAARIAAWEETVRSAKTFLLEDLWDPSCIWGQAVKVNKEMFLTAVKKVIGEP